MASRGSPSGKRQENALMAGLESPHPSRKNSRRRARSLFGNFATTTSDCSDSIYETGSFHSASLPDHHRSKMNVARQVRDLNEELRRMSSKIQLLLRKVSSLASENARLKEIAFKRAIVFNESLSRSPSLQSIHSVTSSVARHAPIAPIMVLDDFAEESSRVVAASPSPPPSVSAFDDKDEDRDDDDDDDDRDDGDGDDGDKDSESSNDDDLSPSEKREKEKRHLTECLKKVAQYFFSKGQDGQSKKERDQKIAERNLELRGICEKLESLKSGRPISECGHPQNHSQRSDDGNFNGKFFEERDVNGGRRRRRAMKGVRQCREKEQGYLDDAKGFRGQISTRASIESAVRARAAPAADKDVPCQDKKVKRKMRRKEKKREKTQRIQWCDGCRQFIAYSVSARVVTGIADFGLLNPKADGLTEDDMIAGAVRAANAN